MTLAPRLSPETEPSARRIESHTLVIESQRRADGDHYVQLSGEVDLACADALTTELLRVEATDARAILLDLSSLDFIDSSGLRALLGAHRRSAADSNRLVLLPPSETVKAAVEIAGLAEVLPFAAKPAGSTGTTTSPGLRLAP